MTAAPSLAVRVSATSSADGESASRQHANSLHIGLFALSPGKDTSAVPVGSGSRRRHTGSPAQDVNVLFAHDTVASLRAAVDLVNTAEEPDTLTTVARLDAWYAEHGYTGRRDENEAELAALRALRPVCASC